MLKDPVSCGPVVPDGIPFPPLPPSVAERNSEIVVVEPDDHPLHAVPPPLTPVDPSLPPLYPVVALGGTFDHLHAGHKILLSMGAWIASEKLIVGITGAPFLSSSPCTPFSTLVPVAERAL